MQPVSILGVPTDFGANRRGVDMGPSAIRYGGLYDALDDADIEWTDVGNIHTPRVATSGRRDTDRTSGSPRHLEETAEVCSRLSDRVIELLEDDRTPLVLGGDHSIAIGTLHGSATAGPFGAIWFDAHADFNTPATSPSGNIHGMPLAAALGYGTVGESSWAHASTLEESNVAIVGLRDVDETEVDALHDSDVTVYTMTDIDRRGMPAVIEAAVDVATDGGLPIHVSLDMDWLDPNEAPGVGTPVRGGVTYREAHTAMEYLAERLEPTQLRSIELVEVNPILDQSNETAKLGCELVASAFGKRILSD